MFTRTQPRNVPATVVEQKHRPDEVTGAVSNGFTYVARADGYRIYRDGVEVAVGMGTACVETNAQRAIQALVNRGVSLT